MYKECPLCSDDSFLRINASIIGDKNIGTSKVFACRGCEFIFKVSKENYETKDIEYYTKYQTVEKLAKRSEARALTDYSRYINYLDLMARHINFDKPFNSLDIGGAEGLFSNVFKENYDSIITHNLEPDQMAIQVGQSLYPDVLHINCKLEDMGAKNVINKFGIVTYWGGLYRTKDPISALRGLTKHLADEAYLFFSFPFFFENASRQDDSPYPSVGYILGNDSWFMPSLEHLKYIFGMIFYSVEQEWIQNIPFKKNIPVFICRYSKKAKKNFPIMKKGSSNLEYLISFATRHTADEILSSTPDLGTKRVGLICEEIEEIHWHKVFQVIGCELFFVRKCRDSSRIDLNIIDFGQIWEKKISVLFLSHSVADAVRDQVIGRLHLDMFMDVYQLSPKSSGSPLFDIDGEEFLGCVYGVQALRNKV